MQPEGFRRDDDGTSGFVIPRQGINTLVVFYVIWVYFSLLGEMPTLVAEWDACATSAEFIF